MTKLIGIIEILGLRLFCLKLRTLLTKVQRKSTADEYIMFQRGWYVSTMSTLWLEQDQRGYRWVTSYRELTETILSLRNLMYLVRLIDDGVPYTFCCHLSISLMISTLSFLLVVLSQCSTRWAILCMFMDQTLHHFSCAAFFTGRFVSNWMVFIHYFC